MRQLSRNGSFLTLAALGALAACSPKDESHAANNDTAAPAAVAAPMTDSAGGAMAGGAMAAPGALSLVGVTNAGEIATSRIAEDKATSSDVRAFAHDMVQDHQAMQKEADELATRINVTPQPTDLARERQQAGEQAAQQLGSTAKGPAFDKAYIDAQVQAHQQAVQDLQALQSSTDNAEVRALAEKAIPKVQDHLQRAQKLQATLK